MENKVKTTTISELEARIAGLINKSDSLPDTLYADENEQEKFLSVMPHCVYTRWHPQGIDILPRGNGKADGIQTTLDHYGLEREEVIAFGDGDNDLSMLKLAGTAVAMGNAVEHVKAAADYVTDTVENDGICQALRHFGLL